jgi:alkaline phosphatase
VQPKPAGALVIDSACSATELATGHPSLPETLGFDADGKTPETILALASRLGKSTGLVSDTRITHATPAAFFARVSHRSEENTIASQLIESSVDVVLSGGLRHFLPKGTAVEKPFTASSVREDAIDLLAKFRQQGGEVVLDRSALTRVKSRKVLGLFANSAMQDGISERRIQTTQPTLREMTTHALRLLSNNDAGFFLMVEGGQIDWAGHGNDAGALLQEMLRFDEAVSEVLHWAAERQDTLVLMTADHETGGFGFSYHARGIPTPVPFPGKALPGATHRPQYNFGEPSVFELLANQREPLWKIADDYVKGAPALQSPLGLQKRVKAALQIELSLESAERVLRRSPNTHYRKEHKDLSTKEWTTICDFDGFYPNPQNRFSAALARELSTTLGIVWATGTHTSTPVLAAWTRSEHFSPAGFLSMEQLGAEILKLWR